MHYSAGDPVGSLDGFRMLSSPPIGIVLDQRIIENNQSASDGVNKKVTSIEQSIFALACAVDELALTIIPFDVTVKLDSISAIPHRNSCTLMSFSALNVETSEECFTNGSDVDFSVKRQKIQSDNFAENPSIMVDVMDEVNRFARILCDTIESEFDSEDIQKL